MEERRQIGKNEEKPMEQSNKSIQCRFRANGFRLIIFMEHFAQIFIYKSNKSSFVLFY